mgnify:CR=1 FL=1
MCIHFQNISSKHAATVQIVYKVNTVSLPMMYVQILHALVTPPVIAAIQLNLVDNVNLDSIKQTKDVLVSTSSIVFTNSKVSLEHENYQNLFSYCLPVICVWLTHWICITGFKNSTHPACITTCQGDRRSGNFGSCQSDKYQTLLLSGVYVKLWITILWDSENRCVFNIDIIKRQTN